MTEKNDGTNQTTMDKDKAKRRPFTKAQKKFCDKIHVIRKQSGYSRKRLAAQVEFSHNSIAFYEKSRLPNIDFLVNLAYVLDFDVIPLMYERIIFGQALPQAIDKFDREFKRCGFAIDNTSEPQNLNLLPTVTTEQQLETKLQLLNYIGENKHIKMIQQQGNSMSPKYEADSWLFVDCKETPLVEGNIYMFEYTSGQKHSQQTKFSAFRVQFGIDNQLILSYENPKFQPVTLNMQHNPSFKLLGEVKGSISIQP